MCFNRILLTAVRAVDCPLWGKTKTARTRYRNRHHCGKQKLGEVNGARIKDRIKLDRAVASKILLRQNRLVGFLALQKISQP